MVLAGEPISRDLQTRRVADLCARREPVVSTPGEDHVWHDDMLERSWAVDHITSKTKLARFEDVLIDESHRLLLPSDGPRRAFLAHRRRAYCSKLLGSHKPPTAAVCFATGG